MRLHVSLDGSKLNPTPRGNYNGTCTNCRQPLVITVIVDVDAFNRLYLCPDCTGELHAYLDEALSRGEAASRPFPGPTS